MIKTKDLKDLDVFESIFSERTGLKRYGKFLHSFRQAKTYGEKKDLIRELAITWQLSFSYGKSYYWGELGLIEGFFREFGKRFGLLTEFRENCIC